ncbi:hypothetical protein [Lentibacillus sp. Marseille-P4043]|uniref:hypothetical protein n=1 Tax=Lentibacillus sp. Marseille-P4043 TaxID=2040293 RepID=UPI000D0BA6DA|nr:hypothetical protein [Lentibacillus sp. Marseille-P4043]
MNLWGHFDKNEIYILIALVVLYAIFFLLPKRFSRDVTLLFLIWGFACATLFDFTIGGGLIDLYKTNDLSSYELFDLLLYFMVAPVSYLFVYLYDGLSINKKTFIWYIMVWMIAGLGAEWISTKMGVTTHQHGYQISYSVAVFLVVLTTTALYYELVKRSRKS